MKRNAFFVIFWIDMTSGTCVRLLRADQPGGLMKAIQKAQEELEEKHDSQVHVHQIVQWLEQPDRM